MTKRVMILATDGFEQSELMKPKANLEKAGIETEVVSLEEGSIRGWDDKDWGESVAVDKTVDNVANCEGYDALLLPGGQINPDIAQDGKLITSRNPGDIPAFSKALIEMLGESVADEQLEAA